MLHLIKVPFTSLVGKTLTSVTNNDSDLLFVCTDGYEYIMYHAQDCCESVYIEDIDGDLQTLVGFPITVAEKSSSGDIPEGVEPPECRNDEETWTFYRIANKKVFITIRWYGGSNGYYSTEVDFRQKRTLSQSINGVNTY